MSGRAAGRQDAGRILRVWALAAFLALSGCAGDDGSPSDSATSEWQGTIETEGDVTTVVNEPGSVWPEPATLVEETTIGVEVGEDAYMLGNVGGLYATDEEIYVLDNQVPVLRVYDRAGRHLRDIGGSGEGPGEFQFPHWVAGTPDGRVLVGDILTVGRINVYAPDGTPLEAWPLARGGDVRPRCCLRPMVAAGDVVWVEIGILNREELAYEPGMRAFGPDGPLGEPMMVPDLDYPRWTLERDGRESDSVPYAPEVVWAIAPPGVMLVGASDDYSFEVRSPDGPVTRVERYWEPVEPIEEEVRYATRRVHEVVGRSEGGRQLDLEWDGRLPATKPAFQWLVPTRAGQIWVMREGRAEPVPDCDPAATEESSSGRRVPVRCFEAPWIIDAFDLEGRYLGEVEVPGGRILSPVFTFVRGDTVLTAVQDEAGTTQVKRYRLVLPAGR